MIVEESEGIVVSKNRLEGSLADTRLTRLLDTCHRHLLTGAIKITAGKRRGVLVLRAGAVDQARFGDTVGDAAVDAMRELDDGSYELAQRLPDLSGHLGRAAALEGEVTDVPLIPIMQLCEKEALSCTIIVIGGFDRGEIVYRAGELVDVTLNGRHDEDAIVNMLRWKDARFRVVAPPLPSDIAGWPKVGREATQPFHLEAALLPPDVVAAKKRHERRLAAGTAEVPKLAAQPTAAEPAAPVAERFQAPAATPPAQPRVGGALVDAFLLTVAAGLAFALAALALAK